MKPVKQPRPKKVQKYGQMYVPKEVPKRSKNPLSKTKSPVKQANRAQRFGQKGCKNGPQKRNQNSAQKWDSKSHPSAQMTSSSILWLTAIFLQSSSKSSRKLRGNRGSLRSHWRNLRRHMKLREKLRGNRGSLRSHWRNLQKPPKFEEMQDRPRVYVGPECVWDLPLEVCSTPDMWNCSEIPRNYSPLVSCSCTRGSHGILPRVHFRNAVYLTSFWRRR
jgi:hypothetical protein